MAFLVETTPESERDAEAILEWLYSQHAGDTGIRWFLALEDAIASLAIAPARCPLAPENADSPFEVRHLLYGRKPQYTEFCLPSRAIRFLSCISGTDAVRLYDPSVNVGGDLLERLYYIVNVADVKVLSSSAYPSSASSSSSVRSCFFTWGLL